MMDEVEKFANFLKETELVLVQFYATWYKPCEEMQPIFENIQNDFNGQLAYLALDVDADIAIAEKYQINSLPTVMVFKAGERVYKHAGSISYEEIKQELDSVIK